METKPWYKSKAVIGGVLTAVAGVIAMFGYAFSPAEVEASTKDTLLIVVAVEAAIGSVLAIWGRVKAKKKLTR